MNWALLAAGVGLAGYQAWAISVRWGAARALPDAERKLMLGTLVATRGLGLVLGVLLIAGAVWRSLH